MQGSGLLPESSLKLPPMLHAMEGVLLMMALFMLGTMRRRKSFFFLKEGKAVSGLHLIQLHFIRGDNYEMHTRQAIIALLFFLPTSHH